jgi:outer membrane protein assembly factor BamB
MRETPVTTMQEISKHKTFSPRMPSPRMLLVMIALLAGVLLTGCIPSRVGVRWASVRLMGEAQNILLTFADYIVIVNPATGYEIALLNEEGTARIDPETNQPRQWQVSLQGAQFFSAPLQVDEDTLLAADYNRRLFYVDVQNARLENATGQAIGGQVVAEIVGDDENIFLPYYNHDLVALNRETFDQVWAVDTDNGIWSEPLLTEEGILYFGSLDHKLYAVDTADGSVLWTLELGGAITGTPALYNDKLYIGSFDRKVYEISLEGEKLNEYQADNWIWSMPIIVDDVLYTADMGGTVYALNIVDGFEEVWKTKATGRGIRPSPLVTDEFVIVAGRDGHVEWLNRETGVIEITNEVQAEILSDILLIEPSESNELAQPLVVVSTIDHSRLLVSFTLNDGAPKWVYSR